MLKKVLSGLLLLVLLFCGCFLPAAAPVQAEASADSCGLRGWDLNMGYQYVIMGYYPYFMDSTIGKKDKRINDPETYALENYSKEYWAPVLWEVLSVEDGKALLYTTYIIDTHQPLEISDKKKADAHKYSPISDYGETDLNRWLNETMINNLLADEPVLAAVTEEKYGRLYPLTDAS